MIKINTTSLNEYVCEFSYLQSMYRSVVSIKVEFSTTSDLGRIVSDLVLDSSLDRLKLEE